MSASAIEHGDEELGGALDLCADGAFSVIEAARFVGVSRSEIYRLMDSGRLRFAKLGRRRVVPRRAAAALLAAGLRGGPA